MNASRLSRLDRYISVFYRGVAGALSNIKNVYPVFVAVMLIVRIGLLVAMIFLIKGFNRMARGGWFFLEIDPFDHAKWPYIVTTSFFFWLL